MVCLVAFIVFFGPQQSLAVYVYSVYIQCGWISHGTPDRRIECPKFFPYDGRHQHLIDTVTGQGNIPNIALTPKWTVIAEDGKLQYMAFIR